MVEKEIAAALLGVLGTLAVAGFGAWGAIKVKRLDQIAAYDAKILEQRLIGYRKLWELTEITSRRNVTAFDQNAANALAEALTKWYYHDGGMFLSARARSSFFTARASLEPPAQETLRPRWQRLIAQSFSALRSALCDDLESRRGPASKAREGT